MKWSIQHRVLHGVYEASEQIPEELHQLATKYEGAIAHRMGWNFPMSFLQRHLPAEALPRYAAYLNHADYVILYRRGDILTKKHELQHARFAMDASYREEVERQWASLSPSHRDRIQTHLTTMGYPEDPVIRLDEFQAYYYTENPSFFGRGGRKGRYLRKFQKE